MIQQIGPADLVVTSPPLPGRPKAHNDKDSDADGKNSSLMIGNRTMRRLPRFGCRFCRDPVYLAQYERRWGTGS